MRIHCLIHASFEKLGVIADWAIENHHHITLIHTYQPHLQLPTVNDFDFLIVMGGPQSLCEIQRYPYLLAEIELIKKSIQADKIILGICLGAQLLAEALGGKTQKSPEKEIGVYSIELNEDGKKIPYFAMLFKDIDSFSALHWHSDMPGINQNIVVLAQSQGCPIQAFRHNKKIYGFQFHLEMTLPLIEKLIDSCPEDFMPNKFVQTPKEITATNLTSLHTLIRSVLAYLASQ